MIESCRHRRESSALRDPTRDLPSGPRHTAREHRALPDQLLDSLLRAGVHPLAGQHGHLLDVFHQHRADGVLPGGLGRLPGCLAELVVDERAGSAGDLDGGLGVRVPVGLQHVQPGHDRRRLAAVAPTDLLRHRCASEGPVQVGRADRGAGRLLLRAGRALVRRAGPGDGAAVRRDRQPGHGLHGRYPRQPGRHRGFRPDVVLPRARLDLVPDRAGDRRRLRPAQAPDPRRGGRWPCSPWSPWPTGRATRSACRPRSSGLPITRSGSSRATCRST